MEILVSNRYWALIGTTVHDGDFATPTVTAFESELHKYESRISLFCQHMSLRLPRAIRVARLAHSDTVVAVQSKGSLLEFIDGVDGLVTTERGVALVVTGGDCPPIFLASQRQPCIGLAHSGRAGALENIAGKLVGAVHHEAPFAPLSAWIGPGICGKCYKVNQEIIRSFSAYPEAESEPGTEHLNLPGVIEAQLRSILQYSTITHVGGCTMERSDMWFSYRRDTLAGLAPKRPRVQAFIAMLL